MQIVKEDATPKDIEEAAIRNTQEKNEFGHVMLRLHERMLHGAMTFGPMLEDLNIAYGLLLKECMTRSTTKAEGDLLICKYVESTEEMVAMLKNLRKEK